MNTKRAFSFAALFFSAVITFASHSSDHSSDASSEEFESKDKSFECSLAKQDLDNFPDPVSLPLMAMNAETPEKYIDFIERECGVRIRNFSSFTGRQKRPDGKIICVKMTLKPRIEKKESNSMDK